MISFLSYSLGAGLAHLLPETLSENLTGLLSRTQYHLRNTSRRNVLANMRLAMGPDASNSQVRAAAKRVFSNFGRSIYSFLRLPYMSPGELRSRCDYGAIDIELDALRRKGGFILVGPHVGPWETGGACLSALGLPIHTVALDHPSARVTKFFEDRRKAVGIQCHPAGRSFAVLCEIVQRGECVALLIDRPHGAGRRTYRMFGRDVVLPIGHAALSIRCRVPVISAVCIFTAGGGLKFAYYGPHYPDLTQSEDAAIEDMHVRCRCDMERFIHDYPDQWLNFEAFAGQGE